MYKKPHFNLFGFQSKEIMADGAGDVVEEEKTRRYESNFHLYILEHSDIELIPAAGDCCGGREDKKIRE